MIRLTKHRPLIDKSCNIRQETNRYKFINISVDTKKLIKINNITY